MNKMISYVTKRLTMKFLIVTSIVILSVMAIFSYFQFNMIKNDIEDQLLTKGRGLAIALSKNLQAITENDFRDGVFFNNGEYIPGDELRDRLYSDSFTIIPESLEAANNRQMNPDYASQTVNIHNGKEIPLSEYELKYTSPYDSYTDERWQQIIDSFLVDEMISFAIPIANSSNSDFVGYVPTHNHVYSLDVINSNDTFGDRGIASQNYRAKRVFNDVTGYNAAVYDDQSDVLLQRYNRIIDGRTIEMWDIAYPIYFENQHWGGVRIGLSRQHADQVINSQRQTIISQYIILFVITLAVIFFLSQSLVGRKLNKIVAATKNLNSHDADLTYRLEVKGIDEFATLSKEINVFITHLQQMLGDVKRTSTEVAASSEELSSYAEETRTKTDHIVKSIEAITNGAVIQEQCAEQSAVGVEEVAIGLQRIVDASSSIEKSSNEMTSKAKNGSRSVETAIHQMKDINDGTSEATEVIKQLSADSREIGQILSMITDISDQTNLLALNASIEAARAGEAGKGFSVVADEIRKLSDQTQQSAKKINELIVTMQSNTKKAVLTMDKSREEVIEGIDIINEVGDVFRDIVASMNSVAEQIKDMARVSEEISANTEEVTASVEEMASSAQEASYNTKEMLTASERQLETINKSANAAKSLDELACNLNERIGRFKVE